MGKVGTLASRLTLAALLLLVCGSATAGGAVAPASVLSGYGAEAVYLRAYTAGRLAYYGGASHCAAAPHVSYARSDVDAGIADAWYVALQVSADAALVRLGAAEYRCEMDKALVYLERLWAADGGYAPRADLDGRSVSGEEQFADDNALIGLTYLDAAAATRESERRAAYLAAAQRVAAYLPRRFWDETFGGGFWWSTRQAEVREGKPAQANALAATLFLRLHAATGDGAWRAWADRTLAWLDETLWDDEAGLYRWSVHYADPPARIGQAVSPHFFNYDQGLLIEAHLLRHQAGAASAVEQPRHPTEPPGRLDAPRPEVDAPSGADLPRPPTAAAAPAELARAQRIATALDGIFWNERRPGYSLRSGVVWIYPVFAAWLTPPLVALHRVDGDPRWLEMARRNVDALAASMRDGEDGGYLDYAFDCTRWTTRRERCPDSGWVVSGAKPSGAQASVQRALAALAELGAAPLPRS